MSGLQSQRKFEEFNGNDNTKKTMEIFTELLAQMYIEDQKLTNKDPMQHLLKELDIETEVFDPDLLVAENRALEEDIATLQNQVNQLSEKLYNQRSTRRDARKAHYSKHSGGSVPRGDKN